MYLRETTFAADAGVEKNWDRLGAPTTLSFLFHEIGKFIGSHFISKKLHSAIFCGFSRYPWTNDAVITVSIRDFFPEKHMVLTLHYRTIVLRHPLIQFQIEYCHSIFEEHEYMQHVKDSPVSCRWVIR